MTANTDLDANRSAHVGALHRAVGRERAWAIFAHGPGLHPDAVEAMTERLLRRRVGVLRVAQGAADPDEGARALVRSAAWLRAEHRAPQLILAHGAAGAAALRAAPAIPEARALALVAAHADPGVEGRLGELGAALLVVDTTADDPTTATAARRIFDAAPHPKGLMTVDAADGALSDRGDAEHAAELVATWARRWLREEPAAEPGPTEVHVAIERARFATHVVAGRHAFVIDEPAALEGADLGPDPYELLLASLGSCMAITLRMYADRKGWPLEAVRLRLTHARTHADDAGRCERERRAVDRIETTLVLEGDLDDAQRARLVEIADRCPVHRTLETGVRLARTRDASGSGR